ncbi:MAG: hypothetical protein ABUS56_11120 [Acidobacteriota bacterium]
MALPWLGLLDVALDITNLALGRAPRRRTADSALTVDGRTPAPLDAQLAGVVVAALKEAFDRDASRLEREREQVERERAQAERTLRLELLRQAGEREIGRLRLLAGVAFGSLGGTLVLLVRASGASVGARVLLAGGWLFLLATLALSFAAQSRVSQVMARATEGPGVAPEDLAAGGGLPWLMAIGLVAIVVACLVK